VAGEGASVKVQKSVFGSENERRLFKTLNSQWSRDFNLWPQLPLAAVVGGIKTSNLTDDEKDFLFKTSVDYTLCTKKDRPLMSIEFDGMGHGFSKDGKYIPVPLKAVENRKRKLDLKLRVCDQLHYPLLIVSYDEKNRIGAFTTLTIVDGLIGQVLAYRNLLPTIRKEVNRNPELEFGDVIAGVEYELEVKWDPIAREIQNILSKLLDDSLSRNDSRSCELYRSLFPPQNSTFLTDPPLPQRLSDRIREWENVRRIGCRMTVNVFGRKFEETVWVRNLQGHGVTPAAIAENVAHLILIKRVLSEIGHNFEKS
jgi:hypothetical protein